MRHAAAKEALISLTFGMTIKLTLIWGLFSPGFGLRASGFGLRVA